MNPRTRYILQLITMLLGVALMVVAIYISRHDRQDTPCRQLQIVIADSAQRRFVSDSEIKQLVAIGPTIYSTNYHAIEQQLLAHPMIKSAQCYCLPNGTIVINLTQRQPVIKIESNGEVPYYIDADRLTMPVRNGLKTNIIEIRGHVGKQQAAGELFDLAQWIMSSNYWSEKIHTMEVTNPKMIVLIDSTKGYRIILGTADGFEQRMNQLEKLYEKGFEQLNWPKYKEIDLRYNGQIIGRK